MRYREPVATLSSADDAVIRHLLDHRSVRGFRADPLPPGTLELIVAAAQSASTSSNKQFWSVVAVEDAARKQRLAQLAAGQMWAAEAPLFLAWIADLARIDGIGRSRGVELEGLDYLESFLVACVDASLAAQNAAVAAEALGLGVVFIGALRDQPIEVARELNLPPKCFALFGMCVGHAAAPAGVKPRLPQQAVLHREQYCAQQWPQPVARYVAHNNAFRDEQRMPRLDWTDQIVERVRTAASLGGREHLRADLRELGIPAK